MPEDVAAVMDVSTESTAGQEIADVSSDSGTSSTESTKEGGQDTVDNADTPQPGETGHLRGSELYRAVKDQLKTLDPKLARSVRNAIHIAAQADKATGGDLQRFEAERTAYSKLADSPDDGLTPEQRVEAVLDERNFWREFDDKYEKGDPGLIEMMASSNPQSFQNLVVPAVNKFAEVNPEGYSALIAKATVQYLASNGLPVQMQILDAFLPLMPEFNGRQQLLGAIEHVKSLMGALDGMAAKPIAPKLGEGTQKPSSGIDNDPNRLAERELSITMREWQAETSRPGHELRENEINRIATGQKATLTEQDKVKIRTAVTEELNARLAADTRYGQAMRGYLQAGNRRAYSDRALSEYKKLIPSITRRHTQAAIDEKKSQPVPKQAVNGKVNQPLPKATQDSNGNQVIEIPGPPKTIGKQVDYSRTGNHMLLRGEAYVKGEKALFKWKVRTA